MMKLCSALLYNAAADSLLLGTFTLAVMPGVRLHAQTIRAHEQIDHPAPGRLP